MDRTKVNIFCNMIAFIGLFLFGCASGQHKNLAPPIQFTEEGKEIYSPTNRLIFKLSKSADKKEKILKELLFIIENSNGYNKYIASRALLQFYKDFPDEKATKEVVKTISENCLGINYWERVANPEIVVFEVLESGPRLYLERPFDWHFRVYVDGHYLNLGKDRLFRWEVKNLLIELDSKKIYHKEGENYGHSPTLLLKEHIPPEKKLGKHNWYCEFDLVGPGGESVRMSKDFPFEIMTMDEYHARYFVYPVIKPQE